MTSPRHAPGPAGINPDHAHTSGHGGHGLMVMLVCVPLVLIAGLLAVTGAAGTGALIAALLCTTMMAAMMFLMPGEHTHR